METFKDLPVKFFASPQEWQVWLAKHYGQPQGLFIKFAKKASGITSITYDQALEVALCYGWIDGISNSLDDTYYLQKFTPRRPKSMWSKRNIDIIERLETEGRMQPSGIAAVEAAKADGRWEQAYDSPSNMTMPEDLQKALNDSPNAKAFFATLNKTNTFAILWHIQTAKKPETRQRRIETILAMLKNNQKFH